MNSCTSHKQNEASSRFILWTKQKLVSVLIKRVHDIGGPYRFLFWFPPLPPLSPPPVFSSLLIAYFYLTGHSPVFIYTTALLYIILLTLCGHLQTQRVCRALHPVSGEDGILVAEVPRGVQHASSAQTSPRRVVGLARPNQSAGRALP